MKFHITSGKNGFHGGTAFRTANKVTLEVWEKDWPSAELALLAILDTFAKKGYKVIYRENGEWKKLPPAKRGGIIENTQGISKTNKLHSQ